MAVQGVTSDNVNRTYGWVQLPYAYLAMYGIQFGAHAICDTRQSSKPRRQLTSKCRANSNPKIRHASLGTKPVSGPFNIAANLRSKLSSK